MLWHSGTRIERSLCGWGCSFQRLVNRGSTREVLAAQDASKAVRLLDVVQVCILLLLIEENWFLYDASWTSAVLLATTFSVCQDSNQLRCSTPLEAESNFLILIFGAKLHEGPIENQISMMIRVTVCCRRKHLGNGTGDDALRTPSTLMVYADKSICGRTYVALIIDMCCGARLPSKILVL
jgi:hypothetical protein